MRLSLVVRFEKRFPGGGTVRADWAMPADRAAVTVLFGPSGCGKTTTVRCLAGLERPEFGQIRFGPDVWVDAAAGKFVPPQRRGVGLMTQDFALFPHLTVAENVGYGIRGATREARRTRVADVLDRFGIAGLAGRYPGQISGGEQQRTALARALAGRPRLILLDEPLSALDGPTRDRLRPELRRLLAAAGVPVVLVTHDRTEAIALADDIVVMDAGTVLQAGPVADVFARPAAPAVARIVGTETVQPGRVLRTSAGISVVQVGRAELTVADPTGTVSTTGDVIVCLRGEDVTLDCHGGGGSARNRLPAVVVGVTPEGPLVRVALNAGFPLTALVTRPAAAELELREGQRLTAVVKATAVHLIPRGS
ncbi:MAG: ATP-binding cassette domain-containing protein [Fimbriiglobus sp.]